MVLLLSKLNFYENKQMYYTSCNRHYICSECSVKLFENKCPMCRQ